MLPTFHIFCHWQFSAGVGSLVHDARDFMQLLTNSVAEAEERGDFDQDGTAYVSLPDVARLMVSCGDGLKSSNPNDYVLRLYRGEVRPFLKRSRAVEVANVKCPVHRIERFCSDSQVTPETASAARASGMSHVLVAVHANGEGVPAGAHDYERFAQNLNGGNLDWATWSAARIREECGKTCDFSAKFMRVSD